jgi:ribosomal protein L34E
MSEAYTHTFTCEGRTYRLHKRSAGGNFYVKFEHKRKVWKRCLDTDNVQVAIRRAEKLIRDVRHDIMPFMRHRSMVTEKFYSRQLPVVVPVIHFPGNHCPTCGQPTCP